MTHRENSGDVGVCPIRKQLLDSVLEAKRHGYDEGGVAVAIARIDIGAVTNESSNGLGVAMARRNMEGGPSAQVTAARVYIHAIVDQSKHQAHVVVLCCQQKKDEHGELKMFVLSPGPLGHVVGQNTTIDICTQPV